MSYVDSVLTSNKNCLPETTCIVFLSLLLKIIFPPAASDLHVYNVIVIVIFIVI